jgi:hypothetical protein
MALAAYQVEYDRLQTLQFPDFGQMVGRALKDFNTFEGTEITWPKNGDGNNAQLTWLLDKLRNTPVDLAGITIPGVLPATLPLQMNWWRVNGKLLIHRWRMAITIDKDQYHDHVNDHKALPMLDRDALIAGDGRPIYQNWKDAIDQNDLVGARAIHEGAGIYNRMIGRAMHRFGPGAPTPRADDLQHTSFQKYLGRCHKLEELEIERAYAASFSTEQPRQGLGEKLRILLTNFETMGACFEQSIAVIASTPDQDISVADLASVPSLLFDKALMLMVDMMSIMFGNSMGISPGNAVKAIVEKWTTFDPGFTLVTSKYRHGRADNSAYGFYKEVIQKRMVEWTGLYWSHLKGSLVFADAALFAFFFSEDELIRQSTFVTLNNYVQQLQDAGPAAPIAQAPVIPPTAVIPAAAAGTQAAGGVGAQEQCPVCVAAGKVFPTTNHSLEYCSLTKRKMGLNRKGQARGWAAPKGGGKGGGKGKGKGKGGKGKGKGGKGKHGKGADQWQNDDWNQQWEYPQPWQPPMNQQWQHQPMQPWQPGQQLQIGNGPPGKGKGQPGPPQQQPLMLANGPFW